MGVNIFLAGLKPAKKMLHRLAKSSFMAALAVIAVIIAVAVAIFISFDAVENDIHVR
jgi:Na+/H+ antiporter NhaB